MTPESAVLLSVVLPLLGAIGVVAAGRWPNLRETVTLATAVGTAAIVGQLALLVYDAPGSVPSVELFEVHLHRGTETHTGDWYQPARSPSISVPLCN